jgi:hypothetical protein
MHPETVNGATGKGRAKLSQLGIANASDAFVDETAKASGRSRTAGARDAGHAGNISRIGSRAKV